MSTKAQNLVRRLIDAVNRQDYTALHDLVDPDYVYRRPGEELRGVAGLQGLLTAYHQAFPDLELVIDDMFGAGDRVMHGLNWQTYDDYFSDLTPMLQENTQTPEQAWRSLSVPED